MKLHFFRLVLGLCLVHPAFAQVTISDGDFGGWASASMISSNAVSPTVYVGTNGNPGFSHQAQIEVSFSFGTEEGSIASWAEDQLWTPGPNQIQNVSFSFDLRHAAGGSGPLGPTSVYPLVRQAGNSYVALSQPSTPAANGVWNQIGPFSALPDASYFSLQTGIGRYDSNTHPDFAPSASPIGFGYLVTGEGIGNELSNFGVDNFLVTFDSNPIPTVLSQTALVRDYVTVFTVEEAQPFEVVYFYVSKSGIGSGPCIPFFGGACLDIISPTMRIGYALTDSAGTAHLLALIPPNAPLITLYCQAIIQRGVGGSDSILSNTTTGTILP